MIHTSRIIRPCIAVLLLVLALTVSMITPQAHIASLEHHAIWVFPDPSMTNPVTDPTARQALIDHSKDSGVDIIYLSVYSSNPNLAGRYMYDDSALADLITQANAKGIQVYAAYGAPDWPSLGCDSNSFPLQRMAEVASYNAVANPSAKFKGVVLDIEPPEPQSAAQFQMLLAQYQCIQQSLPADLRLSVAIRFFWDAQVEFPAGSGIVKRVHEHIIDMDMANVIVMGYRDFAGPADCSNDGLICLDQDEIAYAQSHGKFSLVLVGLETSDPSSTGISNKETFFEEGQTVLDDVAQVVFNHFGYFSFGGFAVHNYQNSYLGGLNPRWPTINSRLPEGVYDAQEVFTPPGANVTVAAGTIASTNISVGFPDVTIPGYTYASWIDPDSASALPNGYQITDNLAFDITTTATFTGPATVCFQNLGIDPVAFSTLRVLHNPGTGFVDETILSGPNAPNPITQTICASVTSFSPFALANLLDITPPTVVAPAPTSAPTDINCQAPVPNVLLHTSASDNSGSVNLQQSPIAGTIVGAGPHTITVTAIDPSGNSSTATTTFTVIPGPSFTVSLTPASVRRGGQVTLKASFSNCASSRQALTLKVSLTTPRDKTLMATLPITLQAGQKGSLTLPLIIPRSSPTGLYALTLDVYVGSARIGTSSAQLTVTP